jgi:CDP-glycerol glycerophosphotransferase (TagB/SpsB family)
MGEEVGRSALDLLSGLLGWFVLGPVAFLFPRRRNLLVVIGKDDGKFVDNAKHFFVQAPAHVGVDMRCVFLSERTDVVELIVGAGREATRYPSLSSIWCLLRCGAVVVDSNEWWFRMRRFLLLGSPVVQLWHGVGFKRIERDKWRNEAAARGWLNSPVVSALRKIKRRLSGRQVRYSAVVTTSSFYRDHVFMPAFSSADFLVLGYPRNAFAKFPPVASGLEWGNVDNAILASLPRWIAEHRRLVVVAPTFRDTRATPIGLDDDTVRFLEEYCIEHSMELIFKFHPHERGAALVRGRHLHLCRSDSDIYPLLPASSALVTDFSSIYMDYLLLDKPVAFLTSDLEDYTAIDRQFQFSFEEMTPGPKANNWPELMTMLQAELENDSYSERRAKLVQLAFEGLSQEGAVPKLIEYMREMRWIVGAAAPGKVSADLRGAGDR